EASIITSLGLLIPFGVFLLHGLVGLSLRDLVREIILPWGLRSIPFFAVATVTGIIFAGTGLTGLSISALLALSTICFYFFVLRSVLGEVQWPPNLARWLSFLKIGPKALANQAARNGFSSIDEQPKTVQLGGADPLPKL